MNGKGTTLTVAAKLGSTSFLILSDDKERQSDLCGNQSDDAMQLSQSNSNESTISKNWIDHFSDFEKSSSVICASEEKTEACSKKSLQNKQNNLNHSMLMKDLQLITKIHHTFGQNLMVFVSCKSLDFRKEDQEGLLEQMSLGLPPT